LLVFGSNYKYDVANRVFEKVAQAYGSGMEIPGFELKTKGVSTKEILMYYPGENPKVVMDEEVYDLCTQMGKDSLNALAALLGHELAHHYEKHDWCSSFSFLLGSDNELVKAIRVNPISSKQQIESQADYFGGFYGYVAGFNTYKVLPKLLDKLYLYYKLPDKLAGYPSKAQRIEIASKRMAELTQWVSIFDAGEFLFAIQQFELASSCFTYLSEKFPSKEIYNNAGVCYLFKAKTILDPQSIPFMLPIEFDPCTNLKSTLRAADWNNDQKSDSIRFYGALAVREFEKAQRIAPDYFAAQINKACAYIVMGNYDLASGLAKELLGNSKIKNEKPILSKIHSILAITAWKNKRDNACLDFSSALDLNNNSINYIHSPSNSDFIFAILIADSDFIFAILIADSDLIFAISIADSDLILAISMSASACL
jgi:tetratricopeptide (TPR) repeat protein